MAARAAQSRPAPAAAAPAARVHTNLDEVQKPAEIDVEPFVAVAGGQEFTFAAVHDLPWDELGGIEGDGDEFMFKTLSEDDYEAFKKLKVPGWKINILMEDYKAHYKIGQRAKRQR
jgi:hypothetical protein